MTFYPKACRLVTACLLHTSADLSLKLGYMAFCGVRGSPIAVVWILAKGSYV